MPKKKKHDLTEIKGPAKTYKTAMLIFVANAEAGKGRFVQFLTGEEDEATLRARGLDDRVQVRLIRDPDSKDIFGKVVSAETAASSNLRVWRARQTRRTDV